MTTTKLTEKSLGGDLYYQIETNNTKLAKFGANDTSLFLSYNGQTGLQFTETSTIIGGDVTVVGNYVMLDTQWNDLKFPATTTRVGANSLPNFDYTDIGLLFPQNDEDEKIYIVAQFGHDRKDGSSISPHIHYIQDEEAHPVFKMVYRWYNNGEDVPSTWTTIETEAAVFDYSSGDTILQILSFPDIAGTGKGLSSVMDIIIYRETGDGVTGDVLFKEFDIHYQIESFGSNYEYTK